MVGPWMNDCRGRQRELSVGVVVGGQWRLAGAVVESRTRRSVYSDAYIEASVGRRMVAGVDV